MRHETLHDMFTLAAASVGPVAIYPFSYMARLALLSVPLSLVVLVITLSWPLTLHPGHRSFSTARTEASGMSVLQAYLSPPQLSSPISHTSVVPDSTLKEHKGPPLIHNELGPLLRGQHGRFPSKSAAMTFTLLTQEATMACCMLAAVQHKVCYLYIVCHGPQSGSQKLKRSLNKVHTVNSASKSYLISGEPLDFFSS